MTDRELLELATKACGSYILRDILTMHQEWNPLASDADAFALARMLEMVIDFEEREVFYFCPKAKTRKKVHYYAGEDRYGIVRAAAEIGKQMA